MGKDNKQMRIRALIILAALTVLTFALLVRIFWIQVVDGEQYRSMVYAQNNGNRTISARRGNIYDRNNSALAVNIPVNTIAVNPLLIRKSSTGLEQIAQSMSEMLQLNKEDLIKEFQKSARYDIIKRKADYDSSNKLKEWVKKNKILGVIFEEDTKRFYPDKNLAAHVIGFTGTDNQGLAGVELSMERYLKGVPGKEATEVDAKGEKLPFSLDNTADAQDGLNVVLTIDTAIQLTAEKELQAAIDEYKVLGGGSVIVMDPKSGEILAMVSKPDFDLNEPFAVSQDVWRNKAINTSYEPGSTFKLITAAAALEEGVITPDSEVVDAPVRVAGWTINSTVQGGRGKETFAESIYNSDNPVFVKLAQFIGLNKFYNHVKAFGFYDKTGIELPGEANSIFQKKPAEIDMATASFGQSFQITPIQLLTAYTAIENSGEMVKPRIIKELTDSDNNVIKRFIPEKIRNVISKETADTLKQLLEGAVLEGTGKEAQISGYRVAGKTGTSETIANGVRSKDRYIASFIGFAPAENPVVSVLVILDDPSMESYYGGMVAAPVAAKIMEYVLNR